jgi:hypothetical protein
MTMYINKIKEFLDIIHLPGLLKTQDFSGTGALVGPIE